MTLFPPIETSPEAVREVLLPLRNDFRVAIYNSQNAFSIGAIIRVAHSFLAREIILIGNAPYYEKASMGMEKYETIVGLDTEEAFFAHVADSPLWAVEKDAGERSLFEVSEYPKDVVFLFGSERAGLPRSLLDKADEIVAIPMYGVNHSFPVTVAAGIVMCDWARRRYASGTIL